MAENIIHFDGFRIRVTGVGNLVSTFFSIDKINSQALSNIAMSVTTAREPTVLANFISQRALLRLEVTNINERASISRVILFSKPLWTQFPQ